MRNFILTIFEPLVNLLIVLYTVGGYIIGGMAGGIGGLLMGGPTFSPVNGLVGAFIGFFVGVLSAGAIFVLLNISDALKEQLDLMREQGRKR